MKYATHTDPRDIRPGTRKYELRNVWWESDDEMAAYEANAKFKKPVKEETVTKWLYYWRYLKPIRV